MIGTSNYKDWQLEKINIFLNDIEIGNGKDFLLGRAFRLHLSRIRCDPVPQFIDYF